MSYVYGDSTSCPFDLNYIELLRHAVDCSCALLLAQHNIRNTAERSGTFNQQQQQERQRLAAMSDAVKLTMSAFMGSNSERLARTAERVLAGARAVIDEETVHLDGLASGELSQTRDTLEHAREAAFRAVEAFILRHDLPGTTLTLRLHAAEDNYFGKAQVATPFGIDAVFSLAIPSAHEWGKPRRVAELSAGTEIRVPQESGWISKRVQLQPLKLDRLFITQVVLGDGAVITLRKAPRSGDGIQLSVSAGPAPRFTLVRLTEDGTARIDEAELTLDGEDAEHVRRLWHRIVDSTQDLASRRQAMANALFEDTPIRELEEPERVAVRLIATMGPTVREIARRSGAPGELVIRRDVGEGRREEIYITKAELHEKVMALPHVLRPIFDPFDLSEGPRSPRAPAPSEPIRLDAAEFAAELTRETIGKK